MSMLVISLTLFKLQQDLDRSEKNEAKCYCWTAHQILPHSDC
jgi:hypothetical protein